MYPDHDHRKERMLTQTECRTVAFVADGGFLHVECARAEYGAVAIERLEYGLSVGLADVSPVSSFGLDEYIAELAFFDDADEPDTESEIDDERYAPSCERCGEVVLP